MPSTNRRSFIATVGTAGIGVIAGCRSVEQNRAPAGSLRFVNEHDLPHSISMRVTDTGSRPGNGPGVVDGTPIVPPAQRSLSASTVVDPGESETYEAVFTEPVWYAVRFTADGREPDDDAGRVTFHPAPTSDERGTFLVGKIYESGEFSWTISSTDDPGPFDD